MKGIGYNSKAIVIAVELRDKFENCHADHFKEISDSYSWMHPQFARNGCRVTILPVWVQSKGKSRKFLHHIVILRMELFLLGRSRSGVRPAVGIDIFRPESELELGSLKKRRLRSPGRVIDVQLSDCAVCPAIAHQKQV